MKTIHEYFLGIGNDATIFLPKGAKILTVQVQRTHPCLWAIVDTSCVEEPRKFRIVGTGRSFDDNPGENRHWEYIDTFQLDGGALVFHVFEDVENQEIDSQKKAT